jgi:CubicO group peptidase (beta-lactamase class C family)
MNHHGTLHDEFRVLSSQGIPHEIYSVTKAVISSLTAIASKDGLLDNPNHRVLDFFDRGTIAKVDERKEAMTVQSLLDMTSGIEWTERLGNISSASVETEGEMASSPDWVKFILDRPMSSAPGDIFNYNSGNPHLHFRDPHETHGDERAGIRKIQALRPSGNHQGVLAA